MTAVEKDRVHQRAAQRIHVADVLVQLAGGILLEKGGRKGQDAHHRGRLHVHVQLVPDAARAAAPDDRQQDVPTVAKNRKDTTASQQLLAAVAITVPSGSGSASGSACRSASSPAPPARSPRQVPGRQAAQHVAEQIPQRQLPHGQGAVEAERLLADLLSSAAVTRTLPPVAGSVYS